VRDVQADEPSSGASPAADASDRQELQQALARIGDRLTQLEQRLQPEA
jgi:hypothetical protein